MKAMAVAPQPRAVEEAVKVLRNGGNAIDAAITAAFIQGVIDPLNCGIGGLGWMHIYLAESDKDLVVDFCSKAGSKATPDIWADKVLDTCPDGRVLYPIPAAGVQIPQPPEFHSENVNGPVLAGDRSVIGREFRRVLPCVV